MQAEATKAAAPAPALQYVPEGGGEYFITYPRFLAGHFDDATGNFIYEDGEDPTYVSASVEFPRVVVLPAGHKLDRAYKPMTTAKPPVPELRKPYNDTRAVPQGKTSTAADASKKAKRPSDTQAI